MYDHHPLNHPILTTALMVVSGIIALIAVYRAYGHYKNERFRHDQED